MSSINQAAVRFLTVNTSPNLFKATCVTRQACLPLAVTLAALEVLVAAGKVEVLALGFYAWREEQNMFARKDPVPKLKVGGFDLN